MQVDAEPVAIGKSPKKLYSRLKTCKSPGASLESSKIKSAGAVETVSMGIRLSIRVSDAMVVESHDRFEDALRLELARQYATCRELLIG